jgi:hypothetical protein
MVNPHPNSGEPGRPTVLLVAHRCGREFFESIQLRLQAAGIAVEFESALEASMTATANETDMFGKNF